MKVMYLPVQIEKPTGELEEETRKYEIKAAGGGWFNLSCDGNFIAKLVSEEECRRVIWSYWTNLGVELAYLTDDDFDEINICERCGEYGVHTNEPHSCLSHGDGAIDE